jgi:hypothetical protein
MLKIINLISADRAASFKVKMMTYLGLDWSSETKSFRELGFHS